MLNELYVQNNNIELIPKTHEKTKKDENLSRFLFVRVISKMLNELFVQNNNIELIPKTHEKTKKDENFSWVSLFSGFFGI